MKKLWSIEITSVWACCVPKRLRNHCANGDERKTRPFLLFPYQLNGRHSRHGPYRLESQVIKEHREFYITAIGWELTKFWWNKTSMSFQWNGRRAGAFARHLRPRARRGQIIISFCAQEVFWPRLNGVLYYFFKSRVIIADQRIAPIINIWTLPHALNILPTLEKITFYVYHHGGGRKCTCLITITQKKVALEHN